MIKTMRPKGTALEFGFQAFCLFMQSKGCLNFLEIGSYTGESIEILKSIITDSFIISIDPYDTVNDKNDGIENEELPIARKIFANRLTQWRNVGHICAASEEVPDLFSNEYFDCVYIDGLHTKQQLLLDLDNYWSKVKVGGYISGHDYDVPMVTGYNYPDWWLGENSKLIRLRIASVLNNYFDPKKIITFPDGSWAVKRTAT